MELWIRSQDREKLLKVDEVHLGLNKEYIVGDIWVNNWIVGEYETKERAIEVLDEIHQRIINLEVLKIAPDSYKILPKDTSSVYEMPQK